MEEGNGDARRQGRSHVVRRPASSHGGRNAAARTTTTRSTVARRHHSAVASARAREQDLAARCIQRVERARQQLWHDFRKSVATAGQVTCDGIVTRVHPSGSCIVAFLVEVDDGTADDHGDEDPEVGARSTTMAHTHTYTLTCSLTHSSKHAMYVCVSTQPTTEE